MCVWGGGDSGAGPVSEWVDVDRNRGPGEGPMLLIVPERGRGTLIPLADFLVADVGGRPIPGRRDRFGVTMWGAPCGPSHGVGCGRPSVAESIDRSGQLACDACKRKQTRGRQIVKEGAGEEERAIAEGSPCRSVARYIYHTPAIRNSKLDRPFGPCDWTRRHEGKQTAQAHSIDRQSSPRYLLFMLLYACIRLAVRLAVAAAVSNASDGLRRERGKPPRPAFVHPSPIPPTNTIPRETPSHYASLASSSNIHISYT